MFVPLVETAIAFAAVMLAVSLFVSALVQVIQNLLHWRGKTLVDTLKQLFVGFRDFHDDPDAHDDTTATRFAHEVLGDPSLHARDVMLKWSDDPQRLAESIEYIHPDDLITLVHNRSGVPHAPDANGPLPATWTGASDKKPKPFATTKNFSSWVRRWFPTVEATHAQEFKRRVRRLTLVVSCTVVVLFCLDGLQLVRTLWYNRTAAENLSKQVDTLNATAARLGVAGAGATSDPDKSNKDLALELQKTATLLDDAGAGIGWQNSWITKRWCAYKGYCADPPPQRPRLFLDLLLFLTGLAFSCVMLSLGAPFWVTTLSSLIRMQNEVQTRRQQPPPPGIGAQTLP
jgi:hypothetical protein